MFTCVSRQTPHAEEASFAIAEKAAVSPFNGLFILLNYTELNGGFKTLQPAQCILFPSF
jgi:hypothetical protein